MYIKLLVSLLV